MRSNKPLEDEQKHEPVAKDTPHSPDGLSTYASMMYADIIEDIFSKKRNSKEIKDLLNSIGSFASHERADKFGNKFLHILVEKTDSKEILYVAAMIAKTHGEVDILNNLDQTPLMIAALNGKEDAVHILHKAGAFLNLKCKRSADDGGYNLLQLTACESGGQGILLTLFKLICNEYDPLEYLTDTTQATKTPDGYIQGGKNLFEILLSHSMTNDAYIPSVAMCLRILTCMWERNKYNKNDLDKIFSITDDLESKFELDQFNFFMTITITLAKIKSNSHRDLSIFSINKTNLEVAHLISKNNTPVKFEAKRKKTIFPNSMGTETNTISRPASLR